jgi:hypothetical protein
MLQRVSSDRLSLYSLNQGIEIRGLPIRGDDECVELKSRMDQMAWISSSVDRPVRFASRCKIEISLTCHRFFGGAYHNTNL